MSNRIYAYLFRYVGYIVSTYSVVNTNERAIEIMTCGQDIHYSIFVCVKCVRGRHAFLDLRMSMMHNHSTTYITTPVVNLGI